MSTVITDRYHAQPGARTMLALILGPGTCATCMEPLGSGLHRELCEVGAGG